MCLFALAGGPGCRSSAPSVSPALPADASRVQAAGDWDDVEASVRYGLSQTGIAALRVDRSDPSRLFYSLLTPRDEPSSLLIERAGEHGSAVSMTCTIGHFGDPKRERELLSQIETRLKQLRGVDVSPIRR